MGTLYFSNFLRWLDKIKIKDDFAFLWKHAYFCYTPHLNHSTKQIKFCRISPWDDHTWQKWLEPYLGSSPNTWTIRFPRYCSYAVPYLLYHEHSHRPHRLTDLHYAQWPNRRSPRVRTCLFRVVIALKWCEIDNSYLEILIGTRPQRFTIQHDIWP